MNNSEIIERMKTTAGIKEDQELAKIFGVTKSAVANWKRGTAISLISAFEFAEKYGVSLDWLITGKEKAPALSEMEVELLKRFNQLDFSQKLNAFNQLGTGGSGVTQTVTNSRVTNLSGGDIVHKK